jgi:ribonuclease T1
MRDRSRQRTVATLLIVALLVIGLIVDGLSRRESSGDTVGSTCAAPAFDDGEIAVEELPWQATDVLERIESGGPFAYEQDGRTFQNRERLLPQRERGYYREYTVATPGSPDRGARRIVGGECGERYYTDDHYDSFDLIVGTP